MKEEGRTAMTESKAPLGVILGVLALVFAVNLGILAYSVSKGVSHEPAPTEKVVVVQAPAPVLPAGAPAVAPPAPAAPAAPVAATIVNPISLPEPNETQGMYIQHCAACHGLTGRGDGPATAQLYPRPRDFVDSPFRFAPRGGGQGELVAAIERSITLGVPRSSMPGFQGVLTEPVIAGLARYVVSLRSEQKLQAGAEAEVEVGVRPPTTPGLVTRGGQLFVSLGCIACHGESGHGDGPSSRGLVDSLGRPVRPADLTSGLFKSGQSPEDLVRVVLKGIPGTPMAAFELAVTVTNPDGTRNLTDAWAVVAYIQSLKAKTGPVGIGSGADLEVRAAPDDSMIFDPANLGWLGVEEVDVELKPIWQREEVITHLSARAARTAENIAICLEWHDDSMDVARDMAVFPDSVSVMFAMGKEVPALPMGVQIEGHKAEAPVNLWHWQADRQFTASKDTHAGAEAAAQKASPGWRLFLVATEARASAPQQEQPVSDVPMLPEFRAALEAGSIQAQPELKPHAVLESNAEGFGTLTLQPTENQSVWGAAAWCNGVWRVVMVRAIETEDSADISLDQPNRIPVTFAVWDGSKRDRDGIKLISGWHWLVLENPAAQQAQSSVR
jgi:cytochrome c oxidase cbb3-type subunit 2